ncbi:membrane dipeptidase [Rhodothermus sp. AH-315-K08]|nr:membrane dipeptidase [Rhodothermus sp. AH-315-K08]
MALHSEILIWDNHACLPLRPDADFLPQLERFRAAGVNVVSINVTFDNIMPWYDGMKVLSFFRNWILARPEEYVLAGSTEQIRVAQRDGKLAVFFDVEGMGALDGEVSLVRTYYDLGVRWMLVAYNLNNPAGGGCMDDDPGLTSFGREVIKEMRRVGMVLCCSHTGERTCLDVFEQAEMPVILSHANPRALVDHPRCVSDTVMKACAQTGGVVGTVAYGTFLKGGDTRAANVARHIDYAVQLIGPEHVGYASDYVFDEEELKSFMANTTVFKPLAGQTGSVPQMFEPERAPELTNELLKLGYADHHIRAIMGENWFRVCDVVWK